jgi:hypothetical protein
MNALVSDASPRAKRKCGAGDRGLPLLDRSSSDVGDDGGRLRHASDSQVRLQAADRDASKHAAAPQPGEGLANARSI